MPQTKIAAIIGAVTGLFVIGATILIALGKDITGLIGLVPVLVTNLFLLVRVEKVEKNTNGNMAKLIDAALENKHKKDHK
jgi:hypothetical protein